jgi:hypothetical protein
MGRSIPPGRGLELQDERKHRLVQFLLCRLSRHSIACHFHGHHVAPDGFCSGTQDAKEANAELAVPDFVQALRSNHKPLDRNGGPAHCVRRFSPWALGGDGVS